MACETNNGHDATREPSRQAIITIRMSPELHAALKNLAWCRRISLNELCVNVLGDAATETKVTIPD